MQDEKRIKGNLMYDKNRYIYNRKKIEGINKQKAFHRVVYWRRSSMTYLQLAESKSLVR